MHNCPWRRRLLILRAIWTVACLFIATSTSLAHSDPLPSWNDGAHKQAIVDFVNLEFMRAFAEKVYGIPPEQVIRTTFETKFQVGSNGVPVLMRQPKIEFVDDGPGKPVGIQRFIGRRPILAFGNSDGDQQMLEWVAAGTGVKLMGLVHHTDAVREWAYDRESQIGLLDKALDEATTRKWVVVDMKQDWKVIYPER